MTDLASLSVSTREVIQVAITILAHDSTRYIIGAGGVFLFVNGLLSRVLAGRRIRSRTLGKGQIVRELATSLRTVLVFSSVGFLIWLSSVTEVGKFYDDPARYGWAWFAASVVILIVAHDAWFYWTHRLIHHPRLFRRLHRTHHKSSTPTPLTSYAFDTGEAAVNAVFYLLMGLLLPLSHLAGFIFLAHMMLRNAIGHSGYELFPRNGEGRLLFDWMTTVTHHDLHHAQAGWNYGLYFTFWDRVMGTEHPSYHEHFAQAVRRPLLKGPNRASPLRETSLMALISMVVLATMALTLAPLVSAESVEPPASIDAIEGDWATEGYGAIVRLHACQEAPNQLCGRLDWLWDPEDAEALQPGDMMLTGFSFDGGRWTGGQLTHPKSGQRFRGELRQRAPDLLDLKGCAARIFCASETWRRLESLPHLKDAGAEGKETSEQERKLSHSGFSWDVLRSGTEAAQTDIQISRPIGDFRRTVAGHPSRLRRLNLALFCLSARHRRMAG